MTVQNGCNDTTLTTRPLAISKSSTRIAIPVSTSNGHWVAAEIVREEFLHSISTIDEVATEIENSPSAKLQAEAHLLADFLAFVAKFKQDSLCTHNLLLATLKHFTTTYLTTEDIHSFVSAFDTETRKSVLTSYYLALSTLESNSEVAADQIPRSPASALLAAAADGQAKIYGLFGGQGTNEVYFDELKNLYDIYMPYVESLIQHVSKNVLQPLAVKAENDGSSFYAYGLDVISWLDGSSSVPPVDYLASIPVSFPLIGLTQLVQYLATCRASNLHPGEMRALFKGATGHSQGIVSAVCIAASGCIDSFQKNTEKALTWLFYSGLRGQEAFPVLAMDPALVKNSVDGGEGTPSPMLGVTGLALGVLEKHINATNKYLPTNSRMAISLFNGPRAFVVTGPARSLYGLVTSLRKIRAPSGLDQSKIPFSQRKAVFNVRFLTVNVPYHSEYLSGVTQKVFENDLEGSELWEKEDLGIPVYHTEDGSDLRELSTSITQSLCDQIFTMPIHWVKATSFPETATHAIDFGP
ncbi:3-oxoacyl-[acyl-carrier-protein] synthase, partial [Serendipita sp. 411]